LEAWERRLTRALETSTDRKRLALERMLQRLTDPRRSVENTRRTLDTLQRRLERAPLRVIKQGRLALGEWETRLARTGPQARLARNRQAFSRLESRLLAAADGGVTRG